MSDIFSSIFAPLTSIANIPGELIQGVLGNGSSTNGGLLGNAVSTVGNTVSATESTISSTISSLLSPTTLLFIGGGLALVLLLK